MEKKEKKFISITTVIILLGIFIAFLISNSQKTPPEVSVQNSEKKVVSAQMGGYEWKVFGNTILADSEDLSTIDYSIDNTLVSKTNEIVTISTTETFSVQNARYVENATKESFNVEAKVNETGNFFTVETPELEGTYICLFTLNFYDKGSADYGVKLVITDDNIYDVEEVVSYRNTSLTNIVKIKEILNKLPYANQLEGIMVNKIDEINDLTITYSNNAITKEDLQNNTVALFALIPELEGVSYEILESDEKIYYSRDEINILLNRDVLEYANNAELWTKEVIYKESVQYDNIITVYTSAVTSILSKISEKEIGEFVAIDVVQRNESGDAIVSGDLVLNEYDINALLKNLNSEYEFILNVDSNDFNAQGGSLVKINLSQDTEGNYIVNAILVDASGERIEENYNAIIENDVVMLQGLSEENVTTVSGE